MFRFNSKPFLLSFCLLLILVILKAFAERFYLQAYLIDIIAIFWMFCLLKGFFHVANDGLAHYAFLFAIVFEIAQFYQIIDGFYIQNSQLLHFVLGSAFDWYDLLAFTVGWLIILLGEYIRIQLDKASYQLHY